MSIQDIHKKKIEQQAEDKESNGILLPLKINKKHVLQSFNHMAMVLHGQKGATTLVAPGGLGKSEAADRLVSAFNRLNQSASYPVSNDVSITVDVFRSFLTPSVIAALIGHNVVEEKNVITLWKSALRAMDMDNYNMILNEFGVVARSQVGHFSSWVASVKALNTLEPLTDDILVALDSKVGPLAQGVFQASNEWVKHGEVLLLEEFKINNGKSKEIKAPGIRLRLVDRNLNYALVMIGPEGKKELKIAPINESSRTPFKDDTAEEGLKILTIRKEFVDLLRFYHDMGDVIITGKKEFYGAVLNVSELMSSKENLKFRQDLNLLLELSLLVSPTSATILMSSELEKENPLINHPSFTLFPDLKGESADSEVVKSYNLKFIDGNFLSVSLEIERVDEEGKVVPKKKKEVKENEKEELSLGDVFRMLLNQHPVALLSKLTECGITELAVSITPFRFETLNELVVKGLALFNIPKGPSLICTESKSYSDYSVVANAASIESKGVMLFIKHQIDKEEGTIVETAHRLHNSTLIKCAKAFMLTSTVVHVSTLNAMMSMDVQVSNTSKTGGIESADLLINQDLSNSATTVGANIVVEMRNDATAKLDKEQAEAIAEGIIGANTRNLISIEPGTPVNGEESRTYKLRIKGASVSESFYAVLNDVTEGRMFPNEVRGGKEVITAESYINQCDTTLLDKYMFGGNNE